MSPTVWRADSYPRRIAPRSRRLRPAAVAALAGAGLLALGACTSGSTAEPSSTTVTLPDRPGTTTPRGNVDGVLAIGMLLPTTGAAASLAAPMIKGVEMAVAQVNAAGGVLGRPVTLVLRDEGDTAAEASAALQNLITQDKVDAVIGPASSKVALALLDPIAASGVVACSPSVTSIALSSAQGRSPGFVRTMPPDTLQAIALARAVAASGATTTALLYPDDDYGIAFSQAMAPELKRLDVGVAHTEALGTTSDAAAVVERTLAAKPAAIVVIGQPEAGAALLRAIQDRTGEVTPVPVFVSDAMRRSDLFELVRPGTPAAVEGIAGTAPAAVPSNASWFLDEYHAYAPGANAAYASYGFDCANLIALAAAAAKTDDPRKFAEQVAVISRSGTPCRDFATCAPLLAAGRNIDLDGASGPLELDAQGDPTVGEYDVFRFDAAGRDVVQRQVRVPG